MNWLGTMLLGNFEFFENDSGGIWARDAPAYRNDTKRVEGFMAIAQEAKGKHEGKII